MITGTRLLKDLDSNTLKTIQKKLNELGYEAGAVDGIFGKNTAHAWAEWKDDNYLGETDKISQDSLDKLLADKPENTNKNIAFDWHENSHKISKYFTVGDVTKGDPRRIPTDPQVVSNILNLAKHLDKIRDDWGEPIGVTSWYRPPVVNREVGGAKNSQHLYGKAADIYPIGGDVVAFQKWLDARWNMALGYGARKGFVHIDTRPSRLRWNY